MWSTVKRRFALHTGVIGSASFVGTGVDDLVISGEPYFASTRQYVVEIDSASETFRWSNDNGGTWEVEDLEIADYTLGNKYRLVNAEGEDEGLEVYFSGGATGHVNTDAWSFTTTGEVVTDTDTAVSSVITNSGSAEGLIIRGEYDKGAENGLQLYLVTPAKSPDSVKQRQGRNLDLGNGGLLYKPEFFELTADALGVGGYLYRINLLGIEHYQLYQVRKGAVGADGLFTAFAETYKILR